MADPDWFADLVKVARQIEDVLVGAAGQLSVRLVVNQLDIEQQQVGVFHQLIKFAEIRLLSCERISTGIQRCVNAVLFCLAEQLDQEVDLQQRFSAAHGNAAFFSPVVFIAERFFQHLVCGLPVGIFCCPGVRVVAELAAHVAALHKNHVAYARSVDGTETLDRMDRALYRAIVVLIHFTHVFSSSFQLTIFAFICIFRYFSISWMPGKFLPFFRVLLDYTEIRGSFQGISMYKIEHIFLCIFFFYYIAL